MGYLYLSWLWGTNSTPTQVVIYILDSQSDKSHTYIGRKLHGQVGNLFLGGLQFSSQLADLLRTNCKVSPRSIYNALYKKPHRKCVNVLFRLVNYKKKYDKITTKYESYCSTAETEMMVGKFTPNQPRKCLIKGWQWIFTTFLMHSEFYEIWKYLY